MNQNPQAWLLKDSAGAPFAVSEIEMVAYEHAPRRFPVPAAPRYCNELILWQERLVPLLHTALLFEPHRAPQHHHIGIFAYQTQPGTPLDYLALSLHAAPHKILVKENTLAPLPTAYGDPRLRPLALSCFSHEGENIPILDLAYLASATLRDSLHSGAMH